MMNFTKSSLQNTYQTRATIPQKKVQQLLAAAPFSVNPSGYSEDTIENG